MSTRIGWPLVSKKISSWVRPGVCEVRASALRPVSALIRLDLPTLERPANAISMPRIGGSTAIALAAATKRHSPANSLRPRSISSSVNCRVGKGAGTARPFGTVYRAPCSRRESEAHGARTRGHGAALCRSRCIHAWIAPLPTLRRLLCWQLVLSEQGLDVVEQLDLGAVA